MLKAYKILNTKYIYLHQISFTHSLGKLIIFRYKHLISSDLCYSFCGNLSLYRQSLSPCLKHLRNCIADFLYTGCFALNRFAVHGLGANYTRCALGCQ